MEHSGKRHVEIFNFSFLDILACVIGLLIFILTVVVISGGINSAARKTGPNSAVHDLEVKTRTARQFADAAASHRREAEQRLSQMAGDIDSSPTPLDAPGRVVALSAEVNQLQHILADYQQEKDQLKQKLTDLDSALYARNRLATLQQETDRLEKTTADMQARTKDVAAAAAKAQSISYYVPRLRPTDKMQSWLEISNGRVWRLNSDDYLRIKSGMRLSYTRSALAAGTTVESILKVKTLPMEDGREKLPANQVVITCIVRPDAYEDFRRLRDLAWSKGYSVHWIPFDKDEEIILTLGGGLEQ
jgi:hypothetical protein